MERQKDRRIIRNSTERECVCAAVYGREGVCVGVGGGREGGSEHLGLALRQSL